MKRRMKKIHPYIKLFCHQTARMSALRKVGKLRSCLNVGFFLMLKSLNSGSLNFCLNWTHFQK